jgi:hypothetical protein
MLGRHRHRSVAGAHVRVCPPDASVTRTSHPPLRRGRFPWPHGRPVAVACPDAAASWSGPAVRRGPCHGSPSTTRRTRLSLSPSTARTPRPGAGPSVESAPSASCRVLGRTSCSPRAPRRRPVVPRSPQGSDVPMTDVVASIVAALALLVTVVRWAASQRSERVGLVLGEKESAGNRALQIARTTRESARRHHPSADLVTTVERSDRARIQIYRALDELRPRCERAVKDFRAEIAAPDPSSTRAGSRTRRWGGARLARAPRTSVTKGSGGSRTR